jgi:hypothetical protein
MFGRRVSTYPFFGSFSAYSYWGFSDFFVAIRAIAQRNEKTPSMSTYYYLGRQSASEVDHNLVLHQIQGRA